MLLVAAAATINFGKRNDSGKIVWLSATKEENSCDSRRKKAANHCVNETSVSFELLNPNDHFSFQVGFQFWVPAKSFDYIDIMYSIFALVTLY